MKYKRKKRLSSLLSVFLALLFPLSLLSGAVVIVSAEEAPFEGALGEYYDALLEEGFPSDYAKALTELHLLHPTWSFEPLLITEGNATYTWDYVIEKETEDPETNLIFASAAYAPYRHPTNQTQYDSGHYQASAETVEYFMDPRNFLNETDVFQFFDLSDASLDSIQAVEAVLKGTFMENALLENGKTYAAYFCEAGAALGVNPVYLAVKVRQEQGSQGTSPIISGECGSLLAEYYTNQTEKTSGGLSVLPPSSGHTAEQLSSYDGYYNFFNVGASGNGVFSIYYNAMKRAKAGTEQAASSWGGDPSWNTKWKALYGGAYVLKTSYIDRYQSTVYLQKFNVDSRASDRNFWGQYMQNVAGAVSEARTLYTSFAAIDGMDLPLRFSIPVYGGMPQAPCKDPANGSCAATVAATEKYDHSAFFASPVEDRIENAPIYHKMEIQYGEQVSFSGVLTHSYGVTGTEYSVDGGDWIKASSEGSFAFTPARDLLKAGSHILVIRGNANFDIDNSSKKESYQFLSGVFYVNVTRPDVTVTLKVGNVARSQTYAAGTRITLPDCTAEDFIGWYASNGTLLPPDAEVELVENLTYTALFMRFEQLDGAALSTASPSPTLRFSAALDKELYELLNGGSQKRLTLFATVTQSGTAVKTSELPPIRYAGADQWMRVGVSTPDIESQAYKTAFGASFSMQVQYDDGTQRTIRAQGEPFTRTASDVASAALADTTVQYTEATKLLLQKVAGNELQ